ncbi:MAG: methyltransferase domain-containing protein [Candidatus Paceibacterota bacterium]|jgi:SAM-dependent methyltransferase
MQKQEYDNFKDNDTTHWWFQGMSRIALVLVQRFSVSPKNLCILDAGCGTGWFSAKINRFGTVYAVDIEEEALAICRSRGVANTVRADVNSLPFPDNFFDMIVSLDVIYHQYIPSDSRVMKEFARTLKPNGRLMVSVAAHEYLRGPHDEVNMTRHRYSRKELEQLFADAGIQVERSTYANFFLFPFVYLKRRIDQLFPPLVSRSDIKRVSRGMNNLFYLILTIESVLIRHVSLPQGSTVFCIGIKK